ncbi:hypothetical protein L3Q82_005682 [Scortum barcoo]|uniref:Uncharacterized protein n=1 Tax=Scortum barcoo TaxID=214431 RepID=A0ACB8V627_9TELE|nr:hypothetical protein L3Q82_005682 [Scortum barcoo]
MTLQCSVLSDSENKTCPGDHNVYWFKTGSDKSHPNIIYTDGNRHDECDKRSDTQKSCIYRFSKSVSSSDAGTYYCAVATCGEILFGNGTKVEIDIENVSSQPRHDNLSQPVHESTGGRDDVNYAALHFSGTKTTRGRKKKELKTEENTLVPVKTVQLGESVTFTCVFPDELSGVPLYWYKQRVGDTLKFIVTLVKLSNPAYGPEFSAFKSGRNTQRTSNYTVVQWPTVSDSVRPADLMTLQCSVLSDSENKTCPGDHNVYWFKTGSDKSHPNIIYTDGNTHDECDKRSDTQKSCIYRFSKNFSSSDAGTYYCAVATCGEILFGDGTKVEIDIEIESASSQPRHDNLSQPVHESTGGRDDVNYAALHFSGTKTTRGRKKKELKTEENTLVPVKTVQLGESVTFTCVFPDELSNVPLYWYKQRVGDTLKFIATLMKHSNPSYGPEFSASRVEVKVDKNISNLTILRTIQEDEGMYHCGVTDWSKVIWSGTYLSLKGNTQRTSNYTVVQWPTVSDSVRPADLMTLQCSVLSDSENKTCPGDHNVYWFKTGSDKSHPNIIYTDGNTHDECDKRSDTQKSCIYHFSKNVSSSDADTLVPVKTVQLGESVTFTCVFPDELSNVPLYWYKQRVGDTLKFIATLMKHSNPSYGPEFSASRVERNTQRTSNYTVVQWPTVSDSVRPGDLMTLQCSVLSDSENKTCPGDHNVYWFKTGSDKSHPNIIYTDGNRHDECDKRSDTQKSCIYRFSKNVSSSDAGTYYCAVATCGEILFGNGTKLGN